MKPSPTDESQIDDESVDRAVAVVRARLERTVRVGIILGTGLGGLAEHVAAESIIPYGEIPHFPRSTAVGHKGRLVCGDLAGVSVVAMQGRCHRYEGYCPRHLALPVRVMRRLGAELLIVSNAAGGINPMYRAGDIVVLEDHVNMMGTTTPETGDGTGAPRRPPAHRPYTRRLVERAMRVARREGFTLHQGVYVGVSGPNYETRGEYRMFRFLGGDVVGMSTIPEVLAAAQCRMETLALSMVTNVARPDAPETVDAEQVVAAAERCEPNMRKIVLDVLSEYRPARSG